MAWRGYLRNDCWHMKNQCHKDREFIKLRVVRGSQSGPKEADWLQSSCQNLTNPRCQIHSLANTAPVMSLTPRISHAITLVLGCFG